MPGYVVALENQRKTYEKLYRKKKTDPTSEAGVTFAMPAQDHKGRNKGLITGGARVVMDTGSSRFQGPHWRDGALEISRHEIAHAMVAPTQGYSSDGDRQSWAVEGFADYMAFRGNKQLASSRVSELKKSLSQGGGFDGKLPDNGSFYEPGGSSPNYTLGYLAIRFIAQKAGEDKAFAFVAEHYRKPRQLSSQLQKATGMGTAQFESAWADYVRKVLR